MGWPPRGAVGGHGGVQDDAMADFDTCEMLHELAEELAGYVVTTPEPAAVSREADRSGLKTGLPGGQEAVLHPARGGCEGLMV